MTNDDTTQIKLGPLPEPVTLLAATWLVEVEWMRPIGDYYTADQRRAYALQANEGVPKTSKVREAAFRDELAKLLLKHKAEIVVTDDGEPFGMHSGIAVVTMLSERDRNGNLIAEYAEFRL